MIQFRPILRDRIIDILTAAVGPGSDPTEYIKTFDKRLQDVPMESLPYLVVNVRMAEKLIPGEIGNPYGKYTWTVHIYYLDMETVVANYDQADERRDHIMARIEKTLEGNVFLEYNNQTLRTVDTDGHSEAVYSTGIQLIAFDESGEAGRQAFTSEILFEVYTDRF